MRTTTTTGPDRPERDDLTDPAEVQEARRILVPPIIVTMWELRQHDPDWLSEAEAYDSAAEAGAARDLELWGDDPWTLS